MSPAPKRSVGDLIEYCRQRGALVYVGDTCAAWAVGAPVLLTTPHAVASTWIIALVEVLGEPCALLLSGQTVRLRDGHRVLCRNGQIMRGHGQAHAEPTHGQRLPWVPRRRIHLEPTHVLKQGAAYLIENKHKVIQ